MSSLLTRRSRLPAVVSAALLFECLSGSYCPATYYSCQHVLAALPQIRVQPFQVHSFRQRHQPVAPIPTALSLYAAFLVAAGYVAIAACKAPVRAEAMPPLRLLPLPAAGGDGAVAWLPLALGSRFTASGNGTSQLRRYQPPSPSTPPFSLPRATRKAA